MKIVHVVYSLEIGGAEMLVAQLCRLQREHGHEVSICAYSGLGPLGEVLENEGFTVYVPGAAAPALTMLRYFRRFRRLEPDVVHCHNVAPTIQAAAAARLAGVPCVISTRHSLVAPPYDRAAETKYSLMGRFCDRITGICEITCENLRGAPLAQKKKILRIYNGAEANADREQPNADEAEADRDRAEADTKRAAAGGEEVALVRSLEGRGAGACRTGARRTGGEPGLSGDGEFVVLFVGRLAAVKNLETLLRAMALAAPELPALRLWIVGDGAVRSGLERLAEDLGVAGRVRFWGQRLDTARFFAAADVFAMSSTSEGLPMSLLQAMSAGLPAVVTDVGGMAEVVRLAGCGELVPVGDPGAMAQAIVALAADTERRQRLGGRARAAYLESFTLERMEEAYGNLYREAART